MKRLHRLAVAGTLSTALLTGAAATAGAAPAVTATASTKAPAKPTITAKPTADTVKAWQKFYIKGEAKGLKAGSTVTLQQKQGTKWVTLPAKGPVDKKHTYSLWAKLGLKGKNSLRMVGGGATSPVFHVTVK